MEFHNLPKSDVSNRKLFLLGFYVMLMLLPVLYLSCSEKVNYTSPDGYDLEKPEKFIMSESLLEISGITFHNNKGNEVFAVQDEEGKVFTFTPNPKKTTSSIFGKSGDYEDLTIQNDYFIVLKSDGSLYSFSFDQIRSKKVADVQEWKKLLPKGEYEGMYADNNSDSIYVLCKDCKDDKDKALISGSILTLSDNGRLSISGTFSIDTKNIGDRDKKKKSAFSPSALAKNPRTNEWYILSSTNRQLVITDSNWQVKEVFPLNPRYFLQPEGIAFDSDNNLYISNEGDEISNGNILKFLFKKP